MDEKRMTTLLLVVFAAVFAYRVFQYDTFTGEAARSPVVSLQPSSGYGIVNVNHTVCIGLQCMVVAGAGANQCASNADCLNQTHLACVGQQCKPVAGTGQNQCLTHSDCMDLSDKLILPTKRVFVTNSTYSGNLGGYGTAVNTCNQLANGAGLGGLWIPWLSILGNQTNTTTHAGAQIVNAKYMLLNGRSIAHNKADLLDGTLQRPININEFGHTIGVASNGTLLQQEYVWTGTNEFGFATGFDCGGWHGNFNTKGIQGNAVFTDARWTNQVVTPCYNNLKNRLYCFER